jgi:catechol 2,3-dioxygenase-like lactoylglutathione lyase family enzyme
MTRHPDDPAQPPVYGLHHSAYRCRDAEETRAFYEDVLGFPLTQALEIEGHPLTGEPVHYLHIFFDIGSHSRDTTSYIAFFEVPEEESAGHGFEFKRQWGMDLHFAMEVEDDAAIARWKQRLEARGLEVEGPHDHGICTSIYFHDPNGYRLEFTTQSAAQHAEFDREAKVAHARLADWMVRRTGARAAAE